MKYILIILWTLSCTFLIISGGGRGRSRGRRRVVGPVRGRDGRSESVFDVQTDVSGAVGRPTPVGFGGRFRRHGARAHRRSDRKPSGASFLGLLGRRSHLVRRLRRRLLDLRKFGWLVR